MNWLTKIFKKEPEFKEYPKNISWMLKTINLLFTSLIRKLALSLVL